MDRLAVGQRELEVLLIALRNAFAHRIHELHPMPSRFVAPHAAQLRRTDVGMTEEAVDPTCLPIARIAGIDEDDGMEVAREPDARREPRGPAAHDGHVVRLRGLNIRHSVRPDLHYILRVAGACSTPPVARRIPG